MPADLAIMQGDMVLDVFRYSRADPTGLLYYLMPDGSEGTADDILKKMKLLPLKNTITYKWVPPVMGKSFADLITQLEQATGKPYSASQLTKWYEDWEIYKKTQNTFAFNTAYSMFSPLRPGMSAFLIEKGKVAEFFKPPPLMNEPTDFLGSFYPSKKILDAAISPATWEDDLINAATSYLGQKTGKTYTTDTAALEPLGKELVNMIYRWGQPGANIDVVSKDYSIEAQEFANLMKPYVKGPAAAEVGGITQLGTADQYANSSYIDVFLRSYEILYGATGKQKAFDYLQQFLKENPWSAPTWGEETIAGMTGTFPVVEPHAETFKLWLSNMEPAPPNVTKVAFLNRMENLYVAVMGADKGPDAFRQSLVDAAALDLNTSEGQSDFYSRFAPEDVMAKSEKLKAAAEEAAAPGKSREEFLARMQSLYITRFGQNTGSQLFNFAMQQASGLDLTTPGGQSDFYTRFDPESMASRVLPSDVQSTLDILGIPIEQMLSGISFGGSIEDAANQVRLETYNKATASLSSGGLSYDDAETLRENANKMLPYLRQSPSGGAIPQGEFLTANAAQTSYKQYLTSSLQEPYLSNAWNYFDSILSQYRAQTGGLTPESPEVFGKYLSKLGPTFFARLTPKKETVSEPAANYQPGGGRVPMR